jgi:MFS family permease
MRLAERTVLDNLSNATLAALAAEGGAAAWLMPAMRHRLSRQYLCYNWPRRLDEGATRPMTTQPAASPRNAEMHAPYKDAQGHAISPGEIAIGVIIGRTSEFFDFFVYAIASVMVFPKLIFPYVDPLTGTLYSFAVFALAFIARPIGSVIFMAVDRAFGKGIKLTIAIFALGSDTVAMGFMPGYADVGWWAVAILIALRFVQGLALGGVWDGLPALLALNAPRDRRGWYAMIPQLGAPFGLLVASGLFAFLASTLSAGDFLGWGWRYPFFVAFAINVVALFARLRIVITPAYEHSFRMKDLEAAPIRDTARTNGRDIIIGAFAPLASFAMFHMVTVFPLSWVFLFTKQPPTHFLIIELVGSIFGALAIVASGMLADQTGRRVLLGGTAIAIGIFSGFAPQLLSGGEVGEAAYMIVGFIILGLSFGQSSGTIAGRFSAKYRYTASAMTSDLSWLVGAAFAPLVALGLSAHFGLIFGGAYLLSGAIVTIVALAINRRMEGDATRAGK